MHTVLRMCCVTCCAWRSQHYTHTDVPGVPPRTHIRALLRMNNSRLQRMHVRAPLRMNQRPCAEPAHQGWVGLGPVFACVTQALDRLKVLQWGCFVY